MRQAEWLVALGTAVSTWRKLKAPWLKARRGYIVSRMHRDSLTFCVETIGVRQWMVTAATVHAYNTSSTVGAVSSCLQAWHKALRVSQITVIEQEYGMALAKVATLERKIVLTKVVAISLT
jgi:hypothetical protein